MEEVIEKLNECAKELNFTLLETPKNSTKSTKIKYKCNNCNHEGYKTISSILDKKVVQNVLNAKAYTNLYQKKKF